MAIERMVISKIKPVCKDCQDRSFDCHTKCEKYKSYRAECDKEMQERFQKKKLERDVITEVSKALKRLGRGMGY